MKTSSSFIKVVHTKQILNSAERYSNTNKEALKNIALEDKSKMVWWDPFTFFRGCSNFRPDVFTNFQSSFCNHCESILFATKMNLVFQTTTH